MKKLSFPRLSGILAIIAIIVSVVFVAHENVTRNDWTVFTVTSVDDIAGNAIGYYYEEENAESRRYDVEVPMYLLKYNADTNEYLYNPKLVNEDEVKVLNVHFALIHGF